MVIATMPVLFAVLLEFATPPAAAMPLVKLLVPPIPPVAVLNISNLVACLVRESDAVALPPAPGVPLVARPPMPPVAF